MCVHVQKVKKSPKANPGGWNRNGEGGGDVKETELTICHDDMLFYRQNVNIKRVA